MIVVIVVVVEIVISSTSSGSTSGSSSSSSSSSSRVPSSVLYACFHIRLFMYVIDVCRAENFSQQVQSILAATEQRNPLLWKAILDPGPTLALPEAHYHSHGSVQEVQVYLRNILPAWLNLPTVTLLRQYVGSRKN